jgi:hypothetical protein
MRDLLETLIISLRIPSAAKAARFFWAATDGLKAVPSGGG